MKTAWFLELVENNQSKHRFLRRNAVAESDTFGGAAPPDEKLTQFYAEAKAFGSQHEATELAKRHELAVFGRGSQPGPHLAASEQPVSNVKWGP